MRVVLWIVQVGLALAYLFAGGIKLGLPVEVVQAQMGLPLPGVFIRFIGTVEILGALGLVLPGLLRIRTALTPLAACGLVMLMGGAAMFTPPEAPLLALLPLGLGALGGFVAYGRWRLAPQWPRRRPTGHHPAILPAA